MARKHTRRKESEERREPPELPEARPQPHEASPGGTEGADAGWAGGASNLGAVINPEPDRPTTYTSKDAPDAPKVDVVARVICDHCGQAFQTNELLNVHRRTAHRPRA